MLDPMDAVARVEKKSADATQDPAEELPSSTVIIVDVKDARGRRYEGHFVYRVPTLGDLIKIGAVKALYLPEGSPDLPANTLVDILGYLNVLCTFTEEHPRPAWFEKALALHDAVALHDLYGRCLDYERKFLRGDSVADGDEGRLQGEGGPDGGDPVHVGRKVQAPSERRETLSGDGA